MTAVVGASAVLAGCATPAPPAPLEPFDAAEYQWSTVPGANTVTGDALLRTVGGDAKTCAALDVAVIPVSPYTESFAIRTWGKPTGGYWDAGNIFATKPQLRPELQPFIRTKKCNAQGQFTFNNLPDGSYYIVASVTWQAPSGGRYSYMETQGGDLAEKVTLAGGKTETITLAR